MVEYIRGLLKTHKNFLTNNQKEIENKQIDNAQKIIKIIDLLNNVQKKQRNREIKLEKYQNLQTAEQRTRSKKSTNAKIMQRMSWSRDWIVAVVPTPSDFLLLLCRLSPAGVRPIVRFSLPASSPLVARELCSEPVTRDGDKGKVFCVNEQ